MKKILFCFIITTVLFNTSCHDILDVDPTTEYSEATIFDSEDNVDLYVTGFYAAIRDASEIKNNSLSDGFSDIVKYTNGVPGISSHNEVLLKPDFITVNGSYISAWGNYDRIRRQNEFLVDGRKYGTKFSEEFMNIRYAETRFIRALLYFQLIRTHGGVIIRDDIDGIDGEGQKDKARSSEAECWDFVINDLQYAATNLPKEWTGKWLGRLTKGCAYTMLTRVGLYAKRWDVSIAAAEEMKKLVDEGYYQLSDSYSDIFTNKTPYANKEIILATYFLKPDYMHNFDKYFTPSGEGSKVTYAVPTNELVDNYDMADGTRFDWNNPTHKSNPYANREPRFYASILYNGATWKGRAVETFVGGRDGFEDFQSSGNVFTTVTGYYLRKYLDEQNTDFDTQGSDQHYVHLRYAEVLLNLAEALAEQNFGQNKEAALAALNDVRYRNGFGVAKIPSSSVNSLSDFTTLLRKERMVELAFEGHRYWDIRRWQIAEQVIQGQQAHGTKITKNADNTYTYQIVSCDAGVNRYFPKKYYYLPVPQSELQNNSLCENSLYW